MRSNQVEKFLEQQGWSEGSIIPLPADASFRRYFRVRDNTRSAILMDAPGPHEDIKPYLLVAKHLKKLGLSAPDIFAQDVDQGFILLEDFGDNTYTRLLNRGQNDEPLYELAVDVLCELHSNENAIKIDIPSYNINRMLDEAVLLCDWYFLLLYRQAPREEARSAYLKIWCEIITKLSPCPETIVLRDYHVDNLMVLKGREGIASCGLLDFQDALIGSPAYDLASLLEDARRDVNSQLASRMKNRYNKAFPNLDRDVFETWYSVLCAQRHCKVAGIFARLCLRDRKCQYIMHIPRVIGLLEDKLRMPCLQQLKRWVDQHLPDRHDPLPDFDPDELQKIINASA